MQAAKEAREARRKRILERGSDRLAYIRGDPTKQRSLKSPPPPPRSEDEDPAPPIRSPRIDDLYESTIASQGPSAEVSPNVGERVGHTQSESVLQSSTTTRTLSDYLHMNPEFTSMSSEASPTRVHASNKTHHNYLKGLARSIDISENVRAAMAFIVGLVVISLTILSCCGHPWGAMLSVLLPSWPIGLVFLTDLALVVGAFIMGSYLSTPSKALDTDEALGLGGGFEKFSRALDAMGRVEELLNISLLCKKAGGAIVLDCSIYVVTLVCGFSVGQHVFRCCDSCECQFQSGIF